LGKIDLKEQIVCEEGEMTSRKESLDEGDKKSGG
jgi:hypothetical protein